MFFRGCVYSLGFLVQLFLISKTKYTNAANTKEIWYRRQIGFINDCIVTESQGGPGKLSLIVSTAQGSIAALNADNGDVLWRHNADEGLFVENLSLLSSDNGNVVLGTLRKYSNPVYDRDIDHLGLYSFDVLNLKNGRPYLRERGHIKVSDNKEPIKYIFSLLNKDDIQKDKHGFQTTTYNDDDRLLDVLIYPKGSLFERWVVLLTKSFVTIIDLYNFHYFHAKIDLEDLTGSSTPFRLLFDPVTNDQDNSNHLGFQIVLLSDQFTVNGILCLGFDVENKEWSTRSLHTYLSGIPSNLELQQYKKHNDTITLMYRDTEAKHKYTLAFYWKDVSTKDVAQSYFVNIEDVGVASLNNYSSFSSPICFVYSKTFKQRADCYNKTTLIYKVGNRLKKKELDGHWIYVNNNILQDEEASLKHLIAKKKASSIVINVFDTEKDVLTKYKQFSLQGTHHPKTELVVFNAYKEKTRKMQIYTIGFNDGVFQFYINETLKWEKDESLSMVVSSISYPSRNFVEITEALSKFGPDANKDLKIKKDVRHKKKCHYVEDDSFESASFDQGLPNLFLDQVKEVAQVYLISYDSFLTSKKFVSAILKHISKALRYVLSFKLYVRTRPLLGNCPIDVIGDVSKRDSKFVRIFANTIPNVCHGALPQNKFTSPYNTYDHALYYERVKRKLSKWNNRDLVDSSIIVVLSALNKLTAISERTGDVIWSRLLTDSFGTLLHRSKLGHVNDCNNNGRSNRFKQNRKCSWHNRYASPSGSYYVLSSPDICEIYQVSKTVLCAVCRNVPLHGNPYTILRWINIFDGSEFFVQRLDTLHSHILPLWWNLSSGDGKSFNLEDGVIVIDVNKHVHIYYPQALSEHHKLVGRRRYDDTMLKARRSHFGNCKLTAIFNKYSDFFEGYAIKNNKKFYTSKVGNELYLERKWTIDFSRAGLTVVAIATPEHMDAYIPSMIVLRNLSVYEKYITSNIMVFITKRIEGYHKQLSGVPRTMLHLVNTETGNILFEEALDREATHPFRILFNENTIDVHYWHAKQLRYVFHTVDLFVNRMFSFVDFGLCNLLPLKFNSELIDEQYKFKDLPMVNTRDFVLPIGVRALGATSSRHGITPCMLIFATSSDMVVLLPRSRISSTSPFYKDMVVDTSKKAPYHYYNVLVNRHEQSPYHPMIDLITIGQEHILDPDTKVVGVRGIVSAPMSLESTSLVFLYGLDLALYHVQPSGQYDAVQGNILYYIVNGIIGILCAFLVYESYRIYARRHRRSFECSKTL